MYGVGLPEHNLRGGGERIGHGRLAVAEHPGSMGVANLDVEQIRIAGEDLSNALDQRVIVGAERKIELGGQRCETSFRLDTEVVGEHRQHRAPKSDVPHGEQRPEHQQLRDAEQQQAVAEPHLL